MKFALFDFFTEHSIEIGEVAWIDNLANIVPADADEAATQTHLKGLESVTVNWPKGKKQIVQYPAKILFLSDARQALTDKMKLILKGQEVTEDGPRGRGRRRRTRIERTLSDSEEEQERIPRTKPKQKPNCLQNRSTVAILNQLKAALPQTQLQMQSSSSDEEEPLRKETKDELIDMVNTQNMRVQELNMRVQELRKQLSHQEQAAAVLSVLPGAVESFTTLVDIAKEVASKHREQQSVHRPQQPTRAPSQPVQEDGIVAEENVQGIVSDETTKEQDQPKHKDG